MASAEEERKKAARIILKLIRAVAIATNAPAKYGIMTENLRTTAVGIFDTATGKWVLRLDSAHPGAPTPHININRAVSGVRDPHMPVPKGALTAGSTATKALQYGGKAALIAAIAVDAYHIMDAVVDDCKNTEKKRPGNKIAEVASSVGGAWTGGFLGAWAGNSTGAVIGGTLGLLFGRVGAVLGAIIGSVIGSMGGAIGGGEAGSTAAKNFMEELV